MCTPYTLEPYPYQRPLTLLYLYAHTGDTRSAHRARDGRRFPREGNSNPNLNPNLNPNPNPNLNLTLTLTLTSYRELLAPALREQERRRTAHFRGEDRRTV